MNSAPPLDKLVPAYIQRFQAYIPSKPDEELKKLFGCSRLFRLNNNENPLGPPPAAREEIERFPPPRASIYPSGDAYYLRQKLGEKFGLHPDQLLVGNGANEVISFVIKAFCQEGDNIITADRTFAVYEWVAEFSGFEARLVPLRDFGFDDEEMLSRIDERTKILFVATQTTRRAEPGTRSGSGGFSTGSAGKKSSLWTKPMPSSCPNRISLTAWPSSGNTRTSWSSGPSPRCTPWPACASAIWPETRKW